MDEDGRGERRGLDEDELRGKWHRRERRAIASLKRGDMDALHFLFVAHSRDVHRVVNAVVRDYHEAEDITQAVFAKLPRAIMRYEERAVPFAAWISRVAKNAALDHVRGRRQTPVEEVRLSESANDNLGRERGKDLLSALSQLPEDQRTSWRFVTSSVWLRTRSPGGWKRANPRSTDSTTGAVLRSAKS